MINFPSLGMSPFSTPQGPYAALGIIGGTQSGASTSLMSRHQRYAMAFMLLEINAFGKTSSYTDSARPLALTQDASSLSAGEQAQFAKVAQDYKMFYRQQLHEHPGITRENAEHNAKVAAIMANRELFPPEGFRVYQEYSGEAFGWSEIPPTNSATSVNVSFNLSFAAISTTASGQTSITMTTANIQASYAEWS